MLGRMGNRAGRLSVSVCIVLTAAVLTACGQGGKAENGGMEFLEEIPEEGAPAGNERTEADPAEEIIAQPSGAEETKEETAEAKEMRERFGEDCIAAQTFEVELSEYPGKVYFVPFAPSASVPEFRMHILRNGETLTEIQGYVPEKLAGEPFVSLDAVSFYDVDYDGNTDIVLIETYGDTGFAAVYSGFAADGESYEKFFMPDGRLSENITDRLDELSISQIRGLLSDGKRNGEFSGWQEAYEAVGRLHELESGGEETYALLYINDDGIPELAAGMTGYYVSLYTFHNGTVYTLMDQWGYGAMGNAGYEYSPRKNSLRNYNADYAGAVMYTTYMTVSDSHSLEITAEIRTVNFDDVNGNGVPDEEEEGSLGRYGVSYIDGREITNEEFQSYDRGGYQYITGTMRLEELRAELGGKR